MDAYAAFFIGCGAIGIPSLILFGWLDRRTRNSLLLNPV
jgi:hypothetical protein